MCNRNSARVLLEAIQVEKESIKRLELIWADGSYRGELLPLVKETFGRSLEVVEKPKNQCGFQVLSKHWIVERSFAWLVRQFRLVKDCERLSATSKAFIYIAMIRLMLRRLATL